MIQKHKRPRVLTVAGSDSGGGAGIQADLKTFTVLGTYGMSVITALTAQNTLGVQSVQEATPDFVGQQVMSVLSDIGADAVKTGMLSSADIIEEVAAQFRHFEPPHLIVDPVMVAKGGSRLLRQNAVDALREAILPLAEILTPNTEEAAVLTGMEKIENPSDMEKAAEKLLTMGPRAIFLKGGHLQGDTSPDLFLSESTCEWLTAPRLENRHTHGTGCTLSAAIAALMAQGAPPLEAVRRAKAFLTGAIQAAQPLGEGIGPVDHLWQWQQETQT